MKILDFKYVDIDKLTVSEENVRKIELTKLSLESLANSIRIFGVINPIIITEDYQIVIGKRRWRACKLLWERSGKEKFRKIPCLVARFEPRFENDPKIEMIIASLIENKSKKMLAEEEDDEALHFFRDRGFSKTAIANILGVSRGLVSYMLSRERQENVQEGDA